MVGAVVVLGSSGALGRAMMAEASARGQLVIGLDRSKRGGLDLAQLDDLGAVLAPLQPGLIVNAAGMHDAASCEADPAAAYAINARLPALLARCSVQHGWRWVQVSTDQYFTGRTNKLQEEQARVSLPHELARSKFAGEAMARTDPACLVLRTHLVGHAGPLAGARKGDHLQRQIAALQRGQTVIGWHDVWASRMEVGQFARALLDLVDVGATGVVNLAGGESTSEAQFLQALALAMGQDPSLVLPQSHPMGWRDRIPGGAGEASSAPHSSAASAPALANASGLNTQRAERLLRRPMPNLAQVAAAVCATLQALRPGADVEPHERMPLDVSGPSAGGAARAHLGVRVPAPACALGRAALPAAERLGLLPVLTAVI